MRKKIVSIIVMMIFAQSVYSILNAQTDPFDRVEKVLRQYGKGVYRDRSFLNKDIIKGEYAYCFIITERPVRWDGREYVPDKESPTCVTMWKEYYDKRKGLREGKIIIWVTRTALGSYEAQISGKNIFPCSKKEAFELAEQIINESGL
jgi:hypothetical protein